MRRRCDRADEVRPARPGKISHIRRKALTSVGENFLTSRFFSRVAENPTAFTFYYFSRSTNVLSTGRQRRMPTAILKFSALKYHTQHAF
jgi:hypothetical protein